ncbi:hypothetical protein AB1303_13525 [Saccharolobus solfataricus]|uniref:Uncharacterized protein n=1 Tax=Saccharolobus solfataricus TaxID=2287 RepID=A0A157SZD5_SACSO|nr:hypothetical protein [Saccharolobus solfataricus]QPG49219.1 hypothetical protein HFC64_04545 [Saccharolobus solfataricus]SAI84379.1 uncharacterised protein [Saccharolobus solfataricus]
MESRNVVLNFNSVSNAQTPYTTYSFSSSNTIVIDNKSGIIIRFKPHWTRVEYHEGKVIIYRDEDGSVSIVEVEYEDE